MSDVDWEKLRAPLEPPTAPAPAAPTVTATGAPTLPTRIAPPPSLPPVPPSGSQLPPPPPVPPPGVRPLPPGASPAAHGRRQQGWWALLAGSIAILLVLGGYFVARQTERSSTSTAIINPASIDEPAAAVAAVVGPSVVQIETRTGLGSGVVYDDDGHILTAAHVVQGAGSTVRVRLPDGTAKQGEVLGSDDASDIAVVKIDGGSAKAATLATGVELQVGQLAVAVGSPFGLDQSVTMGIVSHLERATQTPGGAIPMVQTDAAINPGNSGGALADKEGRIIGINDAIATGGTSDTNAGVGFAIPIDLAKAVADKIVGGRPVEFAFLGVSTSGSGNGVGDGALIVQVSPGSPADKGGLKEGDQVVGIDGAPVRSQVDLTAKVRSHQPGDVVKLQVKHDDGSESEVEVTLGSTRTK